MANTLPHENALFWGLWDEGFNWHTLQRFIAGYQPPTKPVPARNGTYAPSSRRLATKSSGSGRKPPPGQSRSAPNARGPGVGAGPQGRRDPRHRTTVRNECRNGFEADILSAVVATVRFYTRGVRAVHKLNTLALFLVLLLPETQQPSGANVRAGVGPSQSRTIPSSIDYC